MSAHVYMCGYIHVHKCIPLVNASDPGYVSDTKCFVLLFSLAYSRLVPTLDPQLDVCAPLLLQATWKSVPRAPP